MAKRVAACVVTYNRRDLLMECIDCLLSQSEKSEMDIIVVDNASTDGTHEVLADYIADEAITYINTGSNLGGAGGFQRCFREAAERGYEFAWVMDDDCMPQQTALKELLTFGDSQKEGFGFLSSKVLWKDGTICKMNVQRRSLFKNVDDFDKDVIGVDLASFVSLFVPTRVVYEVGLPIKEFFLWTDDWEYTRRISMRYPCYLITSSVVIHKSNSNIGADVATESAERLDRFQRMYRNDVYMYRREGARGFFYECARILYHSVKVVLYAKDSRVKRLRSIYLGTLQGLSFNPGIEYTVRSK